MQPVCWYAATASQQHSGTTCACYNEHLNLLEPCLQSLRSHPLGPEVELSSFSGNSSQVADSVPSSPALSPRLPPLPAQLEPEETTLDLQRWDEAPVSLGQRRKPREYELSAVNHSEASATLPAISQEPATIQPQQALLAQYSPPSAAGSASVASHSNGPQEAEFHTPSSQPDSHAAALELSGQQETQSQDDMLDNMFPSIKKIMPLGAAAQHSISAAHSQSVEPPQGNKVRYHQVNKHMAAFLRNVTCHDWCSGCTQHKPSCVHPCVDVMCCVRCHGHGQHNCWTAL